MREETKVIINDFIHKLDYPITAIKTVTKIYDYVSQHISIHSFDFIISFGKAFTKA